MPHTTVLAFDLNSKAQETCAALAARNGVSDRISIGALFEPADFAKYVDQRVLVLCDIEGAERKLLDIEIAPALAGMDLIVESHECLVPGLTRQLIERFAPTHAITVVEDNGQRQIPDAPAWFNNLAHLDQLLATGMAVRANAVAGDEGGRGRLRGRDCAVAVPVGHRTLAGFALSTRTPGVQQLLRPHPSQGGGFFSVYGAVRPAPTFCYAVADGEAGSQKNERDYF